MKLTNKFKFIPYIANNFIRVTYDSRKRKIFGN